VRNASQNMVKAGIASGFDFLWRTSGIDVPFVLTGYTAQSNIAALLWVGVTNTALVTIFAIVFATILGFLVALARLSHNWLLSTLAGAYVEFVRNIPLLFFVLFWYSVVIASLPSPRESLSIFGVAFLNNRGMTVPIALEGGWLRIAAVVTLGLWVLQFFVARWAERRQLATGESLPVWGVGLVTCLLLPILAFAAASFASSWEVPALRGFNYRGGFVVVPEFVALLASLVTYTAGFIAEVVRGGIEAVPRGQLEAARALGLSGFQTLRLVTVPLAMRVVVPPLTSQYLNVLKNSSFGAAIAYPELVSVFMGSALNATGQAIEIIAITLAIYLSIGLLVSLAMNHFNARMTLVTR
ncbi:MAG: ABC transporter permease subunit, partial [Proteobacteria bacterium]|nr:ABC transporter permease subunit [Pseudomonadota bacterium]